MDARGALVFTGAVVGYHWLTLIQWAWSKFYHKPWGDLCQFRLFALKDYISWALQNLSLNLFLRNSTTEIITPIEKLTEDVIIFFKGWWHLVAFIDHYTHLYEIGRHQLSYFKFDAYFMAYCIESLPQPSSNWKFNWRWPDLNPGPSQYQSPTLPTELSWLDVPSRS